MRPKLEVADIFRRHGDAFRAAQGNRLSHEQFKVMAAIEACRTQALGGHVERCEDCGVTGSLPRSTSGSLSEIKAARESTGCSPPTRPKPKWRVPIAIPRSKSHNLCAEKLVPLHRGFDGLKFNGGLGGPRGSTRISMLRATPAVRLMRPARSRVRTI